MPAPTLTGLRARHWRAAADGLLGRYLFDDAVTATAFAADFAGDPAVALLVRHAGSSPELVALDAVGHVRFDRPVFIIAAPRSGSTLLFELLAQSVALWSLAVESHGVIEGIPALHPATRGFASHRLTEADATATVVEALHCGIAAEICNCLGHRWLALPKQERPESIRLIEKTPENALRVPFIAAAFPSARFIFLIRDARQSISSLIEAWQHPGFVNIPELPGWRGPPWSFLLPPDWQSLQGASLSDIAAFQWRAANATAFDDLAALPPDRKIAIDYSDLVAAPAVVVRRILRFIEIDIDPPLAAALQRPLPESSTTITPPSPIKWRSNRRLSESSFANIGPLRGRLRNLVTPATPRRRHPTGRAAPLYACFLQELADDGNACLTRSVIVDPSCVVQLGATVPLSIVSRARHRDRFVMDRPVLWRQDPGTNVLYPFWARREDAYLLRQLVPGRPPPPLVPTLARQLVRAAILVVPAALTARHAQVDGVTKEAHAAFSGQRWCRLPGVLDSAHIAALARYFRTLVQAGNWDLGDDQVEQRHGWHNETVTRYFHHQLSDLIGRIVGQPVKPTYAYTSAYRGGAALRAHMDRIQCEFTVSLLVEHHSGIPSELWPLWFQGGQGKVAVTVEPGDAVLFAGCELPHWRERAPETQSQTMLLFHYVPQDFVGVLE